MSFAKHVLLSFTLFLLYISLVSAIACHICNSREDENCDSLIDDKYLKNCSNKRDGPMSYGCRKIEQWLDQKILDHDAGQRIIRQCDSKSNMDVDHQCVYRAGFGKSRQNVCHCYTDGCNGGSKMSSLLPMIFLMPSFLVGLFRF